MKSVLSPLEAWLRTYTAHASTLSWTCHMVQSSCLMAGIDVSALVFTTVPIRDPTIVRHTGLYNNRGDQCCSIGSTNDFILTGCRIGFSLARCRADIIYWFISNVAFLQDLVSFVWLQKLFVLNLDLLHFNYHVNLIS